jgi:hypothetical protein
MSASIARRALGIAAMVSGACNPAPSPLPVAGEPSVDGPALETASSTRASAPPLVPAAEARLPVSGAVAKLHEKAFDATSADAKVGQPLCLVTLHDAPLAKGSFYPVALFTDGDVATWRQTAAGRQEPFYAKLNAHERKRASELVGAIREARDQAEETFAASDLVMGVTTLVGERPVTLYFPNDRVPASLGELVAILKGRLEATNAP